MSLTISLYFLRALFLSLSYHISSRSSFFAFCLFDISSRGTMYYCSISDNSFSRSLFFFYLFNSSAHLHRPLLLSIFSLKFSFSFRPFNTAFPYIPLLPSAYVHLSLLSLLWFLFCPFAYLSILFPSILLLGSLDRETFTAG